MPSVGPSHLPKLKEGTERGGASESPGIQSEAEGPGWRLGRFLDPSSLQRPGAHSREGMNHASLIPGVKLFTLQLILLAKGRPIQRFEGGPETSPLPLQGQVPPTDTVWPLRSVAMSPHSLREASGVKRPCPQSQDSEKTPWQEDVIGKFK